MLRTYWPTAAWKTADPAAVGMHPAKLSALDAVIKSEYSNIVGIVAVKSGCIVLENYYHGYGPEDTVHVASVTKSVLSALIGIAVKEGYIQSIDQKVLAFFPEYVPDADNANRQKITLRHLLTMTAPYPFAAWHEPLEQLCMSPDWVSLTLTMLGQGGSIGGFQYSTAGAHLLSAILTRCTGKSARTFANEYLFEPIGMTVIPHYEMQSFGFDALFGKDVRGWVTDPAGNSTGGWGLCLTPRDMARFGFLYLSHGVWNGGQIIPEAWIDESIVWNANNYGYLWWLFKEEDIFAYAAMGDGGNMICCIPEKELVVSIASTFVMSPGNRWTLIKEHILPAIMDSF